MGEDVEKSLYLSYTEILKGLHFIKDAIDFVEQGKDYYVIPLSGQLRAIFVLPHDKNGNLKNYTVGKKGKTRNIPTNIFNLAQKLNCDLEVYTSEYHYKNRDNQYFSHLFDTTIDTTGKNFKRISLRDWMELDIIVCRGYRFKIWEIIKIMADRNGGAHYDGALTRKEMELYKAKNAANYYSLLSLVLTKIGKVLFQIGFKVIRSVFNFQFIMGIALNLPTLTTRKNIATFYSISGFSPLSLSIDEKNMIKLNLENLEGHRYDLDIGENRSDEIIVINLGYEISADMSAILSVYYCNEFIQYRLDTPIFIGRGFLPHFKVYFSDDNIRIGFSTMKLFSRILSPGTCLYHYSEIRKKEDEDIAVVEGKQEMLLLNNHTVDFSNGVSYKPFRDYINDKM